MINNYGIAMKYFFLLLLSLSIAFTNEYELTRIPIPDEENFGTMFKINDLNEVIFTYQSKSFIYCPEARAIWNAGMNQIEITNVTRPVGVSGLNNSGAMVLAWLDENNSRHLYFLDENGNGSLIENPRGNNGIMSLIALNDANVMLVQAYGEGLGDNNGYYLMDKNGVIDEITEELESVLQASFHIYGFTDLFDIILLNDNNNSFDLFSTLDYSIETLYNLNENINTQRIRDFNDNGDIIIANAPNGDLFPAEPLIIMREAKNGLLRGSNTFNISDYGLVHFRPEGIDNNGIVWGVGRKDLSESNRYYMIIDGEIKLLDELVEEELDEGYKIKAMSDDGSLLLDLNDNEFGILNPRLRILEPKADTNYVFTKHDSIRIKWSRPIQDDFINISYKDMSSSDAFIPIVELLEASKTEYMWLPSNEELYSDSIVIKIETLQGKIIESDTVSIRSLNLARKESAGFYRVFEPGLDGWNFGNEASDLFPASYYNKIDYVNGIDPFTGEKYHSSFSLPPVSGKPQDYPFWESFVDLFGFDACYFNIYDDNSNELLFSSYDPRALRYWNLIKEEGFGGACHGMTIRSLMFFIDPQISQGQYLFNLNIDDEIRDEIMFHQTFNQSIEWQNQFYQEIEQPSTMAELIKIFSKNFANNSIHQLLIVESTESSHAILPYKIESDQNSKDVFKLYVYDPNKPFRDDQYIIIDTTENTFNQIGENWTKIFIDIPIDNFNILPTFPEFHSVKKKEKTKLLSDKNLYFFKNNNADIIISSESGELKYENGTLINDIDGANIYGSITSYPRKPFRGVLPESDYTITLQNSSDEETFLALFDREVSYNFDNLEPEESDIDIIKYSDNLEYENGNDRDKKVRFYFPGFVDSIGTMIMIENIDVPGNKKIELTASDTNTFNIKAVDFTGNYDLKLISYYDKVNTTFEIKDNELGNFSEVEIKIENDIPKAIIKTDTDGDGESDTQVEKTAEPTSVEIPQINMNVYPNPANSLINFSFNSKETGSAKLAIRDLRGREVMTEKLFLKNGMNEFSRNITDLKAGIYLVIIESENISYIGKIIKK